MSVPIPRWHRETGVSLIELMISLTISMVIMLAVAAMLSDVSHSHGELNKSGQLMENGRYAVQQLREDIRHAGFYGHFFYDTLAEPATLPDPCEVADADVILAGMALPLQGYNAASWTVRPAVTGLDCAGSFLTDDNLLAGSDILVVRRSQTSVLSGTPIENEVYLQSNVFSADIQFGRATASVPEEQADGDAVTLFKRDGTTPADIRKQGVRLYFIAPCSKGSHATYEGVCTASDDTIPTLKMLALSSLGGTTTMAIQSLAEGVEKMKFTYGIDNSPSSVNERTGQVGDGVPDLYTATPSLDQWRSVVSVKVDLLVRAPQSSVGHVDGKSYRLAGITVAAANDAFKRHVFGSEVRLLNIAGPREVP